MRQGLLVKEATSLYTSLQDLVPVVVKLTWFSYYYYSDHRRVHLKKHACQHPRCQEKSPPVRFATKKDLARHQQANHCPKKSIPCPYCRVELAWRPDNHKRHIDTHHRGGIINAITSRDEEATTWFLVNHPGCANAGLRYRGNTPLFAAAKLGYEKITELLLDNGADIEEKCPSVICWWLPSNSRMVTALSEAILVCTPKHCLVAKLLVRRGADVNITIHKESGEKHPLLHHIVASRWTQSYYDLDLVRLLVDHGADVNAKGRDDRTALHEIALITPFTRECLEMVKILLAGGANRRALDLSRDTASDVLRRRHTEGEIHSNTFLAEAMELLRPNVDDQRPPEASLS